MTNPGIVSKVIGEWLTQTQRARAVLNVTWWVAAFAASVAFLVTDLGWWEMLYCVPALAVCALIVFPATPWNRRTQVGHL